jgi:polysaccharide export outer membrane protein
MPLKTRGQLLAGLAGLLVLWTAGAGCQSSAIRNQTCCGTCVADLGTPTVTTSLGSSSSGGAHRPLFSLFKKERTTEPMLAQGCDTCGTAPSLLRPVPNRTAPVPVGAVASAWQPAQRVPEDIQTTGGVGLERPVLLTPVVSTQSGYTPAGASQAGVLPGGVVTPGPTLLPESPLQPVPVGAGPLPPKSGNTDKPEGDLPPPRKQSRFGQGGLQSRQPGASGTMKLPGYPELPPTMITHPPEAPREFNKRALSAYVIEPPDILIVRASTAVTFKNLPLEGQHLVRPDGTISLGPYGDVFVAGMTLDQAKTAVARLLQARVWKVGPSEKNKSGERFTIEEILLELQVDVGAYNSKFYYVITDGGGYGEQVFKLPVTGNETVLDALAAIQGLPAQASKKKIWVARATPAEYHTPHILPVDWCGITQRGSAGTNYQVYPGDRIYVQSDPLLRFNVRLDRILSPIERLLGVTLLGSSTVNSIKNGGTGINNGLGGTITGR